MRTVRTHAVCVCSCDQFPAFGAGFNEEIDKYI